MKEGSNNHRNSAEEALNNLGIDKRDLLDFIQKRKNEPRFISRIFPFLSISLLVIIMILTSINIKNSDCDEEAFNRLENLQGSKELLTIDSSNQSLENKEIITPKIESEAISIKGLPVYIEDIESGIQQLTDRIEVEHLLIDTNQTKIVNEVEYYSFYLDNLLRTEKVSSYISKDKDIFNLELELKICKTSNQIQKDWIDVIYCNDQQSFCVFGLQCLVSKEDVLTKIQF